MKNPTNHIPTMNLSEEMKSLLNKLKILLEGTCLMKTKDWKEHNYTIYESNQMIITNIQVRKKKKLKKKKRTQNQDLLN